MKPPTIIEFCTDPQLLGLSLSPAQATLLKSSYGEPLDDEELDIFRTCTGRARYPGHRFPEVTVVAGARSGKDSRIAATTVLYESVFGGHEAHVAKGETGTIVLVAQDAKAVGVAFTYIATYLQRSPVLAGLLDGEPLTNSLRLRNGLVVQGFPCTLRSMRGYSIVCAVLDELSFFRLEGQADSDAEIQASVRRGMINFANARLVKVSTPYMRSGVLFDDFQRGFGQDDPDLLVWKASTTLMNPTITEARLDRERRVDPLRFSREYEAEFAEDVESFLPAAWVDAVVVPRRHELPPLPGVRYTMAADPSGGGADAFTAAVVHPEGTGASRKIVVDVCRGWSRPRGGQVDLDSIVGEIASDCRARYRRWSAGDRRSVGPRELPTSCGDLQRCRDQESWRADARVLGQEHGVCGGRAALRHRHDRAPRPPATASRVEEPGAPTARRWQAAHRSSARLT